MSQERRPIHQPAPSFAEQSTQAQIFETGIKVIDLIAPFTGRQDRHLRRRRRGQDGGDPGADRQHRQRAVGLLGVRRRGRAHARGQRPDRRNEASSRSTRTPRVFDKTVMVFGQMNEPPGARLRVALTGLTMAEYFRDEGRDVLLFIDNIFRFVQAGSEVSALLGRMPSRWATSRRSAPRWASCRSASPRPSSGSITSMQAVYVPADDYTDPAPATTFAHLDATISLERAISSQGHLPGGGSAGLDQPHPRPEHRRRGALPRRAPGAADAAALQATCRTSSPSWAWKSFRKRTS